MQHLQDATDFLIQQTNNFMPAYGIILGTGLGALVNEMDIQYSIPYDEIPHFPVSTVESHSGKLIFGQIADHPVVVMQGRFHYYEGYSMEQVVFPVRVMKLLGIQNYLFLNAAGGLNPEFNTSDLMVITDHINLQPTNPLIGRNYDALGPRFPDMSEVYDPEIIFQAGQIAATHQLPLRTGVYVSVPGPMLETKAEYRYLTLIGADAVGMSTVPEIIAARHLNLPCFAVSVITDMCVPGKIKKVLLPDILAAAAQAEPNLTFLIKELIKRQKYSVTKGS